MPLAMTEAEYSYAYRTILKNKTFCLTFLPISWIATSCFALLAMTDKRRKQLKQQISPFAVLRMQIIRHCEKHTAKRGNLKYKALHI
jgi:hypothetical protein